MKHIKNSSTLKKFSCFKGYLFILYLTCFYGSSQTENTFIDEVKDISINYESIWDKEKETIVFTGSSSIRFWKVLAERFPNQQILNTGFGGSQATDLLLFLDDLVLAYNPKKVFIYEGDNDLWAKKRPNQIIDTTEEIINRIKEKNPNTQVVLISAKPSISRWKMRGRYKRLNRKMKRLSKNDPLLHYADVWYPMLNGRKLKTEIFIADGLHMNQKGYDIWYEAMKDFVTNP